MSVPTSVVAVYNTHTEAEVAIMELQRSGFDMKKLSIVSKGYHSEEHVIGYYNVGDRMKFWGQLGAFWGGLCGLLFGTAFLFVPGLGPVLVFGPLAGWIIAAMESAVVVGGLSALGAGLYSIGIPKDSVMQYENQIKMGKFVVVAHGTTEEIAQAQSIIAVTHAVESNVHFCPR